MKDNSTRVIELPQLGIRVFYGAPYVLVENEDERASFIHKHPFYELHIIFESECVIRTDGGVYNLKPEQFCLMAPGVNHTPKLNAEQMRRICISFEVMQKPARLGKWLQQQCQRMPVMIGNARGMEETVQALQQEEVRNDSFSGEYTQTLLSVLILQLARAMESSQEPVLTGGTELDKTRSVLIDQFFNANYFLPAGEEKLADVLGVSRRQLDRILKKLYGKGFQEKVLEIRLEVACDLLLHSEKTVQEISEAVGYSTPSNFTAFFKNATGSTPTQYRRSGK